MAGGTSPGLPILSVCPKYFLLTVAWLVNFSSIYRKQTALYRPILGHDLEMIYKYPLSAQVKLILLGLLPMLQNQTNVLMCPVACPVIILRLHYFQHSPEPFRMCNIVLIVRQIYWVSVTKLLGVWCVLWPPWRRV